MHRYPRKPVPRYTSLPGPYQPGTSESTDNKQQDVTLQEWVPTAESSSQKEHASDDNPTILDATPAYEPKSNELGSNQIKTRVSISRVLQAWRLELLACTLAVVGLMTIIGILYPHQNLPLPRLPYKLTINSLVSICIVAIKTAVLLIVAQGLSQLKWTWFKSNRPLKDFETYDQASRGSLVFNNSDDLLDLWSTVDTSYLTPSEKSHLQNTGYHFDNKTRWSAYETNITYGAYTYLRYTLNLTNFAIINQYYANQSLNPSCFYMTDQATLSSLSYFFENIFAAVIPYESYGYGTTHTNSNYLTQIYNVGNVSFSSFESTFNNLMLSMATFVRQSSCQLYGTNTTGQVIKQVTCVRVRWSWLIFPAALVALTLFFFVLLVVQTRSDTAGGGGEGGSGGNLVYKSSALAALIHGLDTKTQEKLDVATRGSLDRIKKDAQKVYIRWTPTENGYKLAQSGPPGI